MWAAVTGAAASIWTFLTYPVSLPLAIVALLVLPFLVRLVRAVRYVVAPQAAPQPVDPPEPPLSDLERSVLQLLAHADGRYVNFDDAADHLHTSRLLLERAYQALDRRGLIQPHRDTLRGTQLALTVKGRDFIIEQGFRLGRELPY